MADSTQPPPAEADRVTRALLTVTEQLAETKYRLQVAHMAYHGALHAHGLLPGTVEAVMVEAAQRMLSFAMAHTPPEVRGGDRPAVHAHMPITGTCPVTCLALSASTVTALRTVESLPRTVAEVFRLVEDDALAEVDGIGPERAAEVRDALVAAGLLSPGTS